MSSAEEDKRKAQMMFLEVQVEQDSCRSCNSSLNWKKPKKDRI